MKKYSRQREAILKKLSRTVLHPTAEEIYSDIKKEMPEIGLATVYRNLKEFQREGKIIGIKAGEYEHFDYTVSAHAHSFCPVCERVTDIALSEEQIKLLGEIGGNDFSLLYKRTCGDCEKK